MDDSTVAAMLRRGLYDLPILWNVVWCVEKNGVVWVTFRFDVVWVRIRFWLRRQRKWIK